jgi:dihydrofolate reductase
MQISAIVAMGKNRVIGQDNDLMWNIPSETKHYKDILSDHLFLIGRKNYEGSLETINHQKALVLSRNSDYQEKAKSFTNFDLAIQFAKESGESELFVLGGEQIYQLLMPRIDTLYLTVVDFNEEGDSYFPAHENYRWQVQEEFRKEVDKQTPIAWSFQKLKKL